MRLYTEKIFYEPTRKKGENKPLPFLRFSGQRNFLQYFLILQAV